MTDQPPAPTPESRPPPVPPPASPAPPAPARNRFRLEPMGGAPTPIRVVEALLKAPGKVVHEFQSGGRGPLALLSLLLISQVCLLLYGVIVGMFSGGTQLLDAPVKVLVAGWLSGLLCLPSLYIFGSLSGAEITLKSAVGILLGFLALMSLLLIGFAPVSWVFTVSTESLTGMGMLHLFFAGVSFWMASGFLLRAIRATAPHADSGFVLIWFLILLLVMLQMPTTLRPVLGPPEDSFLPQEKKFFLEHWGDQF